MPREGLVILRLHRCVSVTLVCGSLALILLITLFPFDFLFNEARLGRGPQVLLVGWGRSTEADVLLNVVLFMPLGFSLRSYLGQQRRLTGRAMLGVSFGVCCVLSYAIEVLQQFLPGRYPSLVDVLANSLGGALGLNSVYACVWVLQHPQLGLAASVVLAFFLSIPLQWQMRLSTWKTTFPLLLGNERTGDRPWRGSLADIYLADRAFTEAEVAQAVAHTRGLESLHPLLLAFYDLRGPDGYSDRIRHGPALV
jgi:VanZ like family